MKLEENKTYRFHIPARTEQGIEFIPTIKTYTVVDKYKHQMEMMEHQRYLINTEKYIAVRDEYSKIVLIEVKPEYKIEEI